MGMMLQSAMDAIITLDRAGTVVDANPAALRMFGYTREGLVGHDMAERIIPARQRNAHRAGLERVAGTGQSQLAGRRLELRALRASGEEFPCELTIGFAQLTTGPMFTGFVRDLTEREEAASRHAALEEQLRQSQKMQAIGQLAGGIAHDFNNMLQVISGFVAMSIDDLQKGAPVAVSDLQQAAQAADRASDLTRRLLTFSRQQFLSLEVVDFNEALTSSLAIVQRALGEHIELEVHPGVNLPTVKLDRGQFQQVVLNLCLNARDAMAEGGRLIIESELVDVPASFVTDHPWAKAGTYVAMVVADSGTGMTPEVLARIYEPFFTTKELGGGTGLGLAVVYGIVQQHRGFIRVDSSPGEGTSFRLYWPVSGEQATKPDASEAPPPRGGTETILVAEDADAIREYIARTLSGAGYRVITATNGKDAVARLAEDPSRVDLVVLDMVMPKVSGRAAFLTMRASRPDLRGIFLSGYAADELSEQWLAEHQCALLAKPIASRTLLRRVREALDR